MTLLKKFLSFSAAALAYASAAIQGVCAENGTVCPAGNIAIKSGGDINGAGNIQDITIDLSDGVLNIEMSRGT